MQAIHVTADRRKAWNAFVAQSPYFALLQSWEWGEFKEKLGMNQYSAKTRAKRLAWLLASYLVFQNKIYGLQYRYRHRAVHNVHPPSNPPSEAVPGDMATTFYNFQARVGLAQ